MRIKDARFVRAMTRFGVLKPNIFQNPISSCEINPGQKEWAVLNPVKSNFFIGLVGNHIALPGPYRVFPLAGAHFSRNLQFLNFRD